MNYREQLEKLIIKKKGLIITKEVEDAGIPRHYLTIFTRENKLERVTHGVYLTLESFEDEMYTLQVKSKRIVFSHETALYLHELTDRDPLEWSVTIPTGYNGSNLREAGIKVYTVKRELHLIGVAQLKTLYGRPIKVYCKERTICDIVRNRNNMDVAILNEGIKRYLYNKDKNIPLLLRYAKELGVKNTIRSYMEILL
ncbi:type IV toxin-antitoxin system AbiEi family antitoxin domain-containing protein [Clostridium bowmanii]|uniref:type IV toxin-antitoxin system AbiEi family antitoxin domain-containing protein n=1 Tax=Clostridium bowmanii TaxID=132925 RepID=UPI001C0BEB24|nr:type IV toxin-antitoxin system AbiEi family antitoxin domain-containing protein [Clostridium bowmanii]MBU3188317.1 type IV toxin-antitoxin system AbiEi family antitoxin domain-containing protein [Clostridium bowmanii]MCA1072705.1 type IV toxin-antitoxin system AbiEi family antitoxin domain-containing protein [Clostridium bowmanii]